jgi:hypothetical protein
LPKTHLAIQNNGKPRAAEQDRQDVARRRRDWRDCQEAIDAQRSVFVDETALKTDMARVRGWAEGGGRLVEAVSGGPLADLHARARRGQLMITASRHGLTL